MMILRNKIRNRLCILFIVLCLLVCVQFFINYILPRSLGRTFSCLVVEKDELESVERTSDMYYNYYNNISGNTTTFDIKQISFEVPSKPCDSWHQPFLVICILSAPSTRSSQLRSAIRQTWASSTFKGLVRFIFFVGHNKVIGKKTQGKLMDESNLYGDIVIIDYEDTYRKIYYKSISILKWCSNYCSNSQYIAKVDEDIFLDIPHLLLVLNSITIPKVILGFVISDGKPTRNTMNKWRVSEEIYKYDHYPVYISGTTYVISSDLLPGLLLAISQSPIIPNEDVYITGICGKKAGATLLGHCGFNMSKLPVFMWAFKLYVNAHHYNPKEFQEIWNIKKTLVHNSGNWLKYTSLLLM